MKKWNENQENEQKKAGTKRTNRVRIPVIQQYRILKKSDVHLRTGICDGQLMDFIW